jgi:hypothetical protein
MKLIFLLAFWNTPLGLLSLGGGGGEGSFRRLALLLDQLLHLTLFHEFDTLGSPLKGRRVP